MSSLYKELASYEEKDAKIFKGRGSEIQEMYENFTNNEYLVCYADSGEGKSSIIEAGLIPVLRGNFFYPIRIVFKDIQFKDNNIDFNKYVCQAISDEVGKLKEDTSIRVDTIHPQRLSNDKSSEMAEWEKQLIDSYAWLRLRYARLTIDNFVFTPVLIFDQFEEVFTNPQAQEWTDKFFAWLQELTMDLCPKDIVDELESRLGTDRFPQIVTQKHFKAIFSLRSEYIGQLDYWGIQKHYIPQLKNNRYLLRPLTIAGAKEVITQQEGFTGLNDVAEDIVDILCNSQKGKNSVLSKESQLPCIPALFLSVVCSQVYSLPKQEQTDFIQKLRGKGKEAIEKLIDRFYKKAVSECQIPDKDLEVIEESLVNSGGIRQRVSSQSDDLREIDFSKRYMKLLKDARLIRVIPEYNKPEESVELIHDCLCSVIKDRKEERQKIKAEREKLEAERKAELARQEAEEAIRRKNQTEDLTSSFFLLIMYIFITWILSFVSQDKPTFIALLDLNSDHVVKFYNEQLLFNIILGNLAILPILIYSTVKKLRITSWLSVYGLLSNAILLFLFIKGQDKEMGIRTALAVVAIGVPLTTLIYSYLFHINGMPKKEDFKTLVNSIPLIVFFLAVSLYLFYLCICNDAIGLPDPSDSAWGIVVIPLLVHELLRLKLKQKEHLMPLLFLLLSLCLLAYNHLGVSPRYPSYICIVLIICSFLASIWQYRNLSPLRCSASSFIQSIVIIITFVLNIGFNPIRIDYDTVTHVYSWKEVTVKDGTNHIGIAEAFSGDTLIPCVFDSIYNNYLYHSSNRIQYKCDTVDYVGQYRYDVKKGKVEYQCLYIPSREQYIYRIANRAKIDTTLSDSIQYYAAKTYFELRNSNIDFLQKGNLYAIDAIPSLSFLYKTQIEELDRSLETLKVGNVSGKSVADFNKSFARAFYLCMVKDRIVKKDSINLFSLCQKILPMYFYDSSTDFEITENSAFNINFGEFHKSYNTRIKLSDMRESAGDSKIGNDQRIEAWYHYIEFLTLLDISLNSTMYASNLESQVLSIIYQTQEQVREIEEKMRKQNNRLTKLNELTSKEKLTPEQLSEAISLAVEGIKEWDSSNKQITNTKQYVIGELSNLIEERVQIDMDFRQLINKVFLVLPAIVSDSQNIYNADFNNICELLYMVAAVRLYDMSSVYLQQLEYMDGAKMKTYVEFKKTQDEKTKMIQKIRDMASRINSR